MKKLNLCCIILVLTMMICTSCQESEMTNEHQLLRDKELTAAEMDVLYRMRNGENNKIGIEEATQIANEVIGFLDGDVATKGGKSRRIAEIVVLKSDNKKRIATKSSDTAVEMPDTMAYLFNFADSTGYTIIAADTRIETPVFCYTGSGTLGDTIDNPGLAIFLTGAKLYAERSIVEAQQQRDSLLNEILAKIDETGVTDTTYVEKDDNSTKALARTEVTVDRIQTSYSYGPWTVSSRKGPLLSVEWGQDAPFNAYIPKNCTNRPSGKAPVGCVATATAQLMTYWGFPNTIDGYNFNWSLIRQYTWHPGRYDGVGSKDIELAPDNVKNQVARLMERIGSHISMDYSCDESGAYTEDAVSYLRALGYSGGNKQGFNTNTVISSLNNSRPVLSEGDDTQINHSILWGWITWQTYTGGHAWVMDGYLRQSRQVTVTVTKTSTQEVLPALKSAADKMLMLVTTTTTSTYTKYSPYFIHNNWGWTGDDNGYYLAGTFDSNNPADFESTTKSGESYNFQFNNEIFPNIYK